MREQDILPVTRVNAAPLYINSIAIGNYPNDRDYSGVFELQPKSIPWGRRLTRTPLTIPYRSFVPLMYKHHSQ